MDAYIYQAELLCSECGEKIRKELKRAGEAPEDPEDENTYDSDEYPKGPYGAGGGEADTPQHCGSGEDCENALDLETTTVGAFLGNALTSEGRQYVEEKLEEDPDSEVAQLWGEFYGIEAPESDEEDEGDDDPWDDDEEDDEVGIGCTLCGGVDHVSKDCPEKG